jgi:hypothetical protein
MVANLYAFLAGLPAVLGFGAFIFYTFSRQQRRASPSAQLILDHLKQRGAQLPELPAKLTGTHVYKLLDRHEDLRQSVPAEEYQLLQDISKREQREHLFALLFMGGTVALSLILYVILVWKPWEDKKGRPITKIRYDFELLQKASPRQTYVLNQLKDILQGWLDEDRQNSSDSVQRFYDSGFQLIHRPERGDGSRIENYDVIALPGGPKAEENLQSIMTLESQVPNDIQDFTTVSMLGFDIGVFASDWKPPQKFDAQITKNALYHEQLLPLNICSPLQPVMAKFDFKDMSVTYLGRNIEPILMGVDRSIKFWNEMVSKPIYVVYFPYFAGRTTQLRNLTISSDLGPELKFDTQNIQRIDVPSGDGETVVTYLLKGSN